MRAGHCQDRRSGPCFAQPAFANNSTLNSEMLNSPWKEEQVWRPRCLCLNGRCSQLHAQWMQMH